MVEENGGTPKMEFPNALPFYAKKGEQMGLPYYAGPCPKCTQWLAFSGLGYGPCTNCNHWLQILDADTQQPAEITAPAPATEE